MEFHSHQEFLTALRTLIERWCDQRNLPALRRILPGYLAVNGLTDGWVELLNALEATRALGYDAFDQQDWDALGDVIHYLNKVPTRR